MMGGTAHLDDLVLGILRHLKSNSFTANRKELHEAFHALREEFPQLLLTLRFRDRGSFPESLGLDQALTNLEASRLLHRKNAAPRFYEIDPELETAYARFVRERLLSRNVSDDDLAQAADRLLTFMEPVAA